MGQRVNYLVQSVWGYFSRLFRCYNFDNDSIVLSHGRHVINVPTAVPVNNVWLAVSEDTAIPVCGGGSTVVGASVVPGGFNLFADVRSELAVVDYFVTTYDVSTEV